MASTGIRPDPDRETEKFWAGLREHRLLLQRCRACGSHLSFPRAICIVCESDDLDWVEASGRGVVHAATVVHRASSAEFDLEVPYVVALVDLDEGVRMLTNIVGVDPADVRIGDVVQVEFHDLDDQLTLARFAPIRS